MSKMMALIVCLSCAAVITTQGWVVMRLDRVEGRMAEVDLAVRPVTPSPRMPQRVLALPALPVSVGADESLGSKTAPLAMIEFADYQCPFCSRFQRDVLPKLRSAYIDVGRMLFVFHVLPLDRIHPDAVGAAIAAECARRQGQFWRMHDALFASQGRFAAPELQVMASQNKLEMKTFTACVEDPDVMARVSALAASARKLGVSSTPTFLVGRLEGGEQLKPIQWITGAQPFEAFAESLDRLAVMPQTGAR